MSFGAQTPGPGGEVPHCYRHPDRVTGVRCQRCGRPICPECQILAPVGVQCPECVRAGGSARPARRRPTLPAFLRRPGAPVVTYALIAVCTLVWLVEWAAPGIISDLVFYTPLVRSQPWRLLTAGFAHATSSNLLHLPLNMYTLWLFGELLEPALGRARFLAVYLVSMLGGWVAVALLAPTTPVLGASGALFGLMGALFLVVRHGGGQYAQLLVLLGVNLLFGFLSPGIAWQAHLGGLVLGLISVESLVRARRRPALQWTLLVLEGVAALAGVWLLAP